MLPALTVSSTHLTADGRPFFWLGDTAWNAAWRGTADDFALYCRTRAAQGFTVTQIHATKTKGEDTPLPAHGHAPFMNDTPNDAYWHTLRERIMTANANGLYVLLVGVGRPQNDTYTDAMCGPRFAAYLVQLLKDVQVILAPSMDRPHEPVNVSMAKHLRDAGWTGLLTQHPNTSWPANLAYHQEPASDFTALQSGHHGGNIAKAYDAAVTWTRDLRAAPPVRPVINTEAMYDGRGDDSGGGWRGADARRLAYLSLLAGSAGYTYGAGEKGAKVAHATGGIWGFTTDATRFDYWQKALHWPSARAMTVFKSIFTALPWPHLAPAQAGTLAPHLAESPFGPPIAAHTLPPGGSRPAHLLVYCPQPADVTVNLAPAGTMSYAHLTAATWINPATGERTPAASASSGAAVFPFPHGHQDALLLLE